MFNIYIKYMLNQFVTIFYNILMYIIKYINTFYLTQYKLLIST